MGFLTVDKNREHEFPFRVRVTVPLPGLTLAPITEWLDAANVEEGGWDFTTERGDSWGQIPYVFLFKDEKIAFEFKIRFGG